MKEIEIEFKAILSETLFNKIKNDINTFKEISYTSHYFDSKDDVLKKNNMALRIRKSNESNKMTIKHKIIENDNKYYFIEISDFLGMCETTKFIDGNIIVSKDIKDYFDRHEIDTSDFSKHNVFNTNRYIYDAGNYILFLDENFYENGVVDYELEIECITFEECEEIFNYYQKKYNLTRNHKHKIERAIENKE